MLVPCWEYAKSISISYADIVIASFKTRDVPLIVAVLPRYEALGDSEAFSKRFENLSDNEFHEMKLILGGIIQSNTQVNGFHCYLSSCTIDRLLEVDDEALRQYIRELVKAIFFSESVALEYLGSYLLKYLLPEDAFDVLFDYRPCVLRSILEEVKSFETTTKELERFTRDVRVALEKLEL